MPLRCHLGARPNPKSITKTIARARTARHAESLIQHPWPTQLLLDSSAVAPDRKTSRTNQSQGIAIFGNFLNYWQRIEVLAIEALPTGNCSIVYERLPVLAGWLANDNSATTRQ